MMKILSTLKSLSDFVPPFLAYHLAGSRKPVLAGYKITHRCNLRCRHCPYWKRSGEELDFPGVVNTMKRLKNMGVRILILEGGEPLIWRSGHKTIRDVVIAARELFASVCITTNGILPWGELALDRAWVSLDGPREIHDSIRGDGVFDRVVTNLESSGKGRSFVSATVNSLNLESIPKMVRMLKGKAAGVTIQFHYPYDGLPDPLFVPTEDRSHLLDELIDLKRNGYPVANSLKSLGELKRDRWTCEDKLLANAEPDGTVLHGCYLKNRAESNCFHCGFSAHNEMSLAFKGRPQSILTGLRIFFDND
jgi:Fe-coproporphyrin III synthase